MAELRDAAGGGTDDDVGHMSGAEAAAQAVDGLEQARHRARGGVTLHRLAEADVARAAIVALVGLAEVRHERAMAAHRLLAERVHLAQLAQGARRRRGAVRGEHRLPQAVVAAADQQQALRLQPVAARAARLLLVVLQRFRHAGMDHVAHVRAIDAHAECDRRHDDVGPLVDERLLVGAALVVRQPRVVAQRAEAPPPERRGQLVHLAAADAVDDAGLIPMPVDRGGHLREAVGARAHAVDEVRTVERADEDQRVPQPQLRDDVVAHGRRRRGRVGVDGERGIRVAQDAELTVLRPEVVAPLADAVRFVHRDEGRLRAPQALEEPVHDQALGGDVEQLHAAGVDGAHDGGTVGRGLTAVDHRRRDAGLAQAVHLVLHERDQR